MSCTSTDENRGCHSGSCQKASSKSYDTLAEVIAAYEIYCEPDHNKELKYFAEFDDIFKTIERAVLSRLWDGKMVGHQRRIGAIKLKQAKPEFDKEAIKLNQAINFEEIYKIVKGVTDKSIGLGELVTYDISCRIAASKNIYPTEVFLHAGTAEGAKKLGFKKRTRLTKLELMRTYPEFNTLNEDSIENFFCIFKDRLAKFNRSPPPK